jgi:hypothetical protein
MDADFAIDEDNEDVESVVVEEQRSTESSERTLREDGNEEGQTEDEDEPSHTPPSPSVAGRENPLFANSWIDADEMSTLFATTAFRAAASSHGHVSRMTLPGAQQDFNIVMNRAIVDPQANMGLEYLCNLETTIKIARFFVFPSRGSFNMSGLLNALPTDLVDQGNFASEYVKFRSTTQIERDKRIGAAAELFVRLFHILQSYPLLCYISCPGV